MDGGGQTLTLSGNNTYGGTTTINSGDTLMAGSTTALTGATSVTDNGTLDLDGNSLSIRALNGTGIVTDSGNSGHADGDRRRHLQRQYHRHQYRPDRGRR